jgi:hypothetical protein
LIATTLLNVWRATAAAVEPIPKLSGPAWGALRLIPGDGTRPITY